MFDKQICFLFLILYQKLSILEHLQELLYLFELMVEVFMPILYCARLYYYKLFIHLMLF